MIKRKKKNKHNKQSFGIPKVFFVFLIPYLFLYILFYKMEQQIDRI